MATIYSLGPSITDLSYQELLSKLNVIRTSRRRRPERTIRASKKEDSKPTKVVRAKNHHPKTKDISAAISKLSPEMKAALAAELLGGLK
jgi:hypothetical protein